ncbi:zinc ribbon domain-containing protein [Cohnella cellulosilytica]|uniref:Zinc ribbon domain-containing protein n=1 Tax=Cohnella cellulosilytica TaxID=986710 RepID=A0ABW2F7M0_9BACL
MQQTTIPCQSCGMPLTGPDVQGTDESGGLTEEYCIYCYENGAFTQPDFKMEDMIGFCVPFLVEQGLEEKAARELLAGSLPGLKRWASEADV